VYRTVLFIACIALICDMSREMYCSVYDEFRVQSQCQLLVTESANTGTL